MWIYSGDCKGSIWLPDCKMYFSRSQITSLWSGSRLPDLLFLFLTAFFIRYFGIFPGVTYFCVTSGERTGNVYVRRNWSVFNEEVCVGLIYLLLFYKMLLLFSFIFHLFLIPRCGFFTTTFLCLSCFIVVVFYVAVEVCGVNSSTSERLRIRPSYLREIHIIPGGNT
jgi:hypothetical protein